MTSHTLPTNSYSKSFERVAVATLALLLIPMAGNLFIEGWQWGPEDFVFAAIWAEAAVGAIEQVVGWIFG